MKKHVGIVLKKCRSSFNKYFIFDRSDGKIICIVHDIDLIQGSLISYFVCKRTSAYFITSIQLIEVPFVIARDDVLFLHHVLELCYYFLPMCVVAVKTFDILMRLFTSTNSLRGSLRKKLFLFKLLVSFEYYTEYDPLSIIMFNRLSFESIDSIVNSHLHLEVERDVDKWLCSCIGAHPRFENFKTVHFLEKIRLP